MAFIGWLLVTIVSVVFGFLSLGMIFVGSQFGKELGIMGIVLGVISGALMWASYTHVPFTILWN